VILGILSDTHGRADAALAGVKVLTDAGAEFLIHCGDVGSKDVLDALAGIKSAFVFGNTDWDRAPIEKYASLIGVDCLGVFGSVTLADKRIAVMHGDDFHLRAQITEKQEYDYLLLGHTHVADDRRVGRIRVINPGALFRARQKTVAALDLAADKLQFIEVST
jgi:uncharacterized protein